MKKGSKKKNQELVSPAIGDITIPDYLRKGIGRGMEQVQKEDILLPRIKLLQALSPEVVDLEQKNGTMSNSVTNENYGAELLFIPVLHWKSRIYFEGIGQAAKILCASQDGLTPTVPSEYAKVCLECLMGKWNDAAKTKKDQAPKCNIFYNFIILLPEYAMTPIALSLGRTKIKIAKKLLSTARYIGGGKLDLFALKFKLGVKIESSDSGPFNNFTLINSGFATEKEYNQGKNMYQSMKDLLISVDKLGKDEEIGSSDEF